MMDTALLNKLHEQRQGALWSLGLAAYESHIWGKREGCRAKQARDEEWEEERCRLQRQMNEAIDEVAHIEWLIKQVKEGRFGAGNTDAGRKASTD